jgi:hypothetical protein
MLSVRPRAAHGLSDKYRSSTPQAQAGAFRGTHSTTAKPRTSRKPRPARQTGWPKGSRSPENNHWDENGWCRGGEYTMLTENCLARLLQLVDLESRKRTTCGIHLWWAFRDSLRSPK